MNAEPEMLNVCGNCDKKWKDDELAEIKDVWERIEPGELLPSGECPECGALCHPDNTNYRLHRGCSDLLDAAIVARSLIDGYIDVVDGDYGEPRPNKAMRAAALLDKAISDAQGRQ